ncbi:MAG: tetratricopeptide repeat protein [Euryarchaeota archaeon]|nr:tetratricopeptide repeat protein [Euryarchaeota archaeon]
MTDLAEKLDQNEKQRLIEAVRNLGVQQYRDLMISLMGGMGVRVQSAREQQNALIIHGQGEVPYLVLASRTGFADPELVARSLVEDAKTDGRVPVFMSMQDLDPGTLNLLENEEVSFADTDRFLSLLQKYGLDEQLLAEEDIKVLEDRGEPCLPSVCKLEELLDEAGMRRKKGDRSGAVQVLDQALQIKPMNDSIWLRKANYLLEMGRAGDALVAANKAAELRPGDAGTWFTIALIQGQLGDRERELSAYDNVLRISPGHAPALLNKGATLYDMGRLEWALKVFNDMVHRYPHEPRGWNNRGLALKGMGKLLEAQASFEKASALDPDFEDPLINIARLREEKGDMPGAVEGWKDVLRLVDSRADIWAHLGTCLRATGKNEDALTAFDRALRLEPSLHHVRRERDELASQMPKEGPETVPVDDRAFTEDVIPDDAGPPVPPGDEDALEGPSESPPDRSPDGSVALEQVSAQVPAERPGQVSVQATDAERSVVQVPERNPLVELPSDTALLPKEEPGKLEEAPDTVLPAQFQSGPLAIEETADTGLVLKGPSEDKEAREKGAGVQESAPNTMPEWPYRVSLPPLPTDRDDLLEQEAYLLLAGKEYEKALRVCDMALGEGNDLDLLRTKALALLALDRGEEAAEALKEVVRQAPDDARSTLDLEALFHRYGGEGGELLRSLDCQESRARHALDLLERQMYSELVRMDAGDGGLLVKLSRSLALVRLGRYRDASKLLKALISEFPAYPEGLNDLGVCMRFMGEYDYDQAMHLMKLALEVDPHHSDAMNNIGCTLFAAGRYEDSLEALKAAVEEDRRPEYLLNLSNAQMALGDTDSAKMSLTSALKMEESADVLYMLAVIAEGEKDHKWALSLYQDALKKCPGFREAQAGADRMKVLAKN